MSKRRVPFAFVSEAAALNDQIEARLARRTLLLRNEILSSSNTYRMKHGRIWKSMHACAPDETQELKEHSLEAQFSFSKLIDHDLSLLREFLMEMPDRLHRQFMETMIETLNECTSASGNVVAQKDLKQGLEEALLKIRFGVDKYGKPSRPELMAHPELVPKLEAMGKDKEYEDRIERISEIKEKEALANEARRISRYKFT